MTMMLPSYATAGRPNPRLMKLRLYIAALALLLIGFGAAEAQPSSSPAVERPCRICHADMFASATQSPHSVLDSAEWQETHGEGLSCLSCHGDVAEHIGAGGRAPVFSFNASKKAVAKNASTSLYGNIVALDESPLKEGLLYVGTDDCLIQVSEDGGANWRKIEQR